MSSALGAVGRRVACVSKNPPFESQLEWIENVKREAGIRTKEQRTTIRSDFSFGKAAVLLGTVS